MTKTTENEAPNSRADILKLKAKGKYQEFPYKVPGLKVSVSAKGLVGFVSRFRRPGGTQGILRLGPLDRTNRKPVETPVIGQSLTPEEAITLASVINTQRKNGVDVVAKRHVTKQFSGREKTFPTQVLDFAEYDRQHHRCWRETAAALGYRFPRRGDGEPTLIQKGLCDRWHDRPIAEITDDDLADVVKQAQDIGLPGWGVKGKGSLPSRGRRLAAALGSLYLWLKRENRIKANVLRNVSRPGRLKPRERALNIEVGIRGADELRWFWAAAGKAGYPYGQVCQVLLLTGCRREEISQMQWSELSDDFSTLHLPGARTKNGRAHDVPLSKQVRDILKNTPRLSDTYVFVTGNRRPIGPGHFSILKPQLDLLMLNAAVKDRNQAVTIPPWQLHDLRRTASTGMNSIGVFPHIVEAVLNHLTGARNGVAGVYNKAAYTKEKGDALDLWGAYVDRVVSAHDVRNVVPLRR